MDSKFPEYIIPDLVRMVMTQSDYADRKVWNFVEDTGPIHEKIRLTADNIKNCNQFTTMIISDVLPIGYLPYLTHLCVYSKQDMKLDVATMPNLVELNMEYTLGNIQILNLDKHKHLLTLHMCPGYKELPRFPSQLQVLRLNNDYNGKLDISYLYELRSLDVSHSFNQQLDLRYNINLNILRLGQRYSRPLHLTGVPNLTMLVIGNGYNCRLNLDLVPHLRTLHIGSEFNNELDLSKLLELKIIYLANEEFLTPLDTTYNIQLRNIVIQRIFLFNPHAQPIIVSPDHNITCNKPERLQIQQ